MSRFTRPSIRTLAVALPLALGAVIIPSIAMADSTAAPHVFNGCVDQNGILYVTIMDADPGCADLAIYLNANKTDATDPDVALTDVSWNQQGASGAPGTSGTAGKSGVSGYQTVSKTVKLAKHQTSSVTVSCPSGKKVTGGGVHGSSASVNTLSTYPTSNSAGWTVQVTNTGSSTSSATAYAICANV